MRSLALFSLLAVAALSACGAEPPSEPTPADPERTTIAALGDSITAGSPRWDPREEIRARIGDSALDRRSQYGYWLERERPGIEVRNCGVFGERTDEIAARLGECADGADALIVQGGINDIAQGAPPAAAESELRSIVAAGKAMGLAVAVTEVLPWNNGHPAAVEPILELNRRIARIGREQEIPVLPFHSTLEDPEAPGRMAAPWTEDGDHPSVAGYRRLAERALLPQIDRLTAGQARDPRP